MFSSLWRWFWWGGGESPTTTLSDGRVFYFAGRDATSHAARGHAPAFAFRGSIDNLDR